MFLLTNTNQQSYVYLPLTTPMIKKESEHTLKPAQTITVQEFLSLNLPNRYYSMTNCQRIFCPHLFNHGIFYFLSNSVPLEISQEMQECRHACTSCFLCVCIPSESRACPYQKESLLQLQSQGAHKGRGKCGSAHYGSGTRITYLQKNWASLTA